MKKFKIQNVYLVFALLLTVFMAGCSNGGDDVIPFVDTTAPTVNLTVPAMDAVNVPFNSTITATFGESMLATTITTTTFTVTGPAGPVAGEVTYLAADRTAIFTPTANLAAGATYTATITTGVTDLAGNPLAVAKVWSFTTVIAPTVTLTVPATTATEVAFTSKITANFSKEMTATTITTTTFTVTGTAGPVAGVVTYVAAARTAVFTPAADLAASTLYTATITTGVKDLAGNPLAADHVWTFITGTAVDTTAPTVFSTDPLNNATDVTTDKKISAAFSEPLDPATIIAANFTLAVGVNPPITGTLAYAGHKATFTPTDGLEANTTYTATIAGVQDLAGNPLGSDYAWTFTTAATVASGPQAPVLGEAGRFVILASQAVTTTSGSVLSGGDLGILDQARTYYAGFTEPAGDLGHFNELTNGYTYAHDDMPPAYVIPAPYASTIAFIDQVRTDLGIAYSFLAADPNPGSATIACPTQLGGLTLTQGVYKTAVDVLLTSGPLHLDAQGDSKAVFIFSIEGNLTVGAPSGAIILDNGALAKNVYFRTGGKTAIEAGRNLSGNIFAWSQINVEAGASITGRLFALTDQVTLISDAVTAP